MPCRREATSLRFPAGRCRSPSSRPARTCAGRGGWLRRRRWRAAWRRPSFPSCSLLPRRQQVDAAARRVDPLDADRDRIPEPDRGAPLEADQHRLGLIELVALTAADPARRQEAFVDVGELAGEANEGAGPDHAGDLALERSLRAGVEQLPLEQERGADRVGVALNASRLPLSL